MENKNPNSTAAPPETDRLSALPDVILEDILSLLPTSAAAATAVLSRRWHHLWTRVTRIHFDADDFSPSIGLRKFLTSVESALRRLDSFTNIRYFYVRFRFEDDEFDEPEDNYDFWYSFINRWFGRICGLHTERILISDVDQSYHNGEYSDFVRICVQNSVVLKAVNFTSDDAGLELPDCPVCLPPFLFQSETLIELSLTNMFLHQLPEIFNLPNLKIFAVNVLVLSETLISVDAPKLEQFSVKILNSLFIRFVSIPSALSSAQLILHAPHFGEGYPANQMMEILRGISCITSLAVTCTTVKILNRVTVNALPSFQNLTHLSLLLSSNECRILDIPEWLYGKVKSIEVKVSGNLVGLSLLKDLLSKATVLERFCVSFSHVTYGEIDLLQQKENDFVKDLFMFPRVSSHCEIEFKGIVVSASTNDP